jgi:predicted transcriptional regulator
MNIADFMKIFASERRIEILDALLRGESRDQIKEGVPASTFAFTVDYLKKVGFAEGSGGDVNLTESGRANLVIFQHFKKCIDALLRIYLSYSDHKVFIPDEFLIRLDEIADFELVASEPSDILKPHRVFSKLLRESSKISGVSPLLFPDYPDLFRNLADSNIEIELVVTEDVYKIISEYPLADYRNLAIWVIDEMPLIAVTVTDRFLSFGFFYKSGSYDFTRDLVATSPSALRFGHDLVSYYMKQSRRII